MNPCDPYAIAMLRSLRNELHGSELEAFHAHLETCAQCRASLRQEQALSVLLTRSRPLYQAPDALSARISTLLQIPPLEKRKPSPVRDFIAGVLEWTSRLGSRPSWNWKLAAASLPVVALGLVLIPGVTSRARAADYVESAIHAHRDTVDGKRPLDLESQSPEAVSAWLAGRVPFHFQLPASQSTPTGKDVYTLKGASLITYQSTQAALVTYESGTDKVSLLVASSDSAVVAGGDEVREARLTFHRYRISRFRAVTWSSHGVSYALVSSTSVSERESCMVCHQDMADRGAFRSVH